MKSQGFRCRGGDQIFHHRCSKLNSAGFLLGLFYRLVRFPVHSVEFSRQTVGFGSGSA